MCDCWEINFSLGYGSLYLFPEKKKKLLMLQAVSDQYIWYEERPEQFF